ncbi:MAG: hypothetical protein APR53_06245 [Methanoculleus sp. SDB]|nr:MAG: hypothetical protein APR53_06245 [Methanoculleus sp. SDB]
MEEAVRCHNAGERVLLTCYNNPLSGFMKKTLGERAALSVGNYHGFCDGLFRKAGIRLDRTKIDNTLFLEQYPKCLAEALAALPKERYDVIIIDEGQDFPPELLTSLEQALDPTGKGKIRLFYDDNQDVYHNRGQYLEKLHEIPFALTLNLRNPQKIHELARHFYKGKETSAIGPEGLEVTWIVAETPDEVRWALHDYIRQLVEKKTHPALRYCGPDRNPR